MVAPSVQPARGDENQKPPQLEPPAAPTEHTHTQTHTASPQAGANGGESHLPHLNTALKSDHSSDAAPKEGILRHWSLKRLRSIHDVPDFHHYPFVVHGYRPESSLSSAITSLFTLHNQTVNVWTHLLGCFYFVVRAESTLSWLSSHSASTTDMAVFALFSTCAAFQMFASALYHTFAYLSPAMDNAMLRLDIAGIVLMIFGSVSLGVHIGFLLEPVWRNTYMVMLGTPLLIASIMTASPSLQSSRMTSIRNALLAGTVAAGALPATHWAMNDVSGCNTQVFWAVVAMFGGYGVGFMFYLSRVPEILMPGRFDLLGSSHQVWHVCVWIAGASWMQGMTQYWSCVNHGTCASRIE